MHIILLSGGSGKKLWPLSNGTSSKQFFKLLTAPDGEKESMVQCMARQIDEAQLNADITVATAESQKDSILALLGHSIKIVIEPERRDTFPVIAPSCAYLLMEEKLSEDEPIVVMPCDSYVDSSYFEAIEKVAQRATSVTSIETKSGLSLMAKARL